MSHLRLSFSYQNPLKKRFTPEFFQELPETPGVYFMYDSRGALLYIGKAKSLRARLSSYRNAKPGAVSEKVLEMLEEVASIRWEDRASEEAALLREKELLHAIRPPFNIADAWEEDYLFIGIRFSSAKTESKQKRKTLHLRLTSREAEAGYQLYGCFKHRPKIKSGYTAVIRLMYAVMQRKERFSYPSKITRASPPYNYSLEVPHAWRAPIDEFFSGQSLRFLELLVEQALQNESIPPFMYPSIQEDFERAKRFFALGPEATRELRLRHGLRTEIVLQRKMDRLIQKDFQKDFEYEKA